MGKQPVQGQKKSKDSIAKAATQKKAGAKVAHLLFRNGPREKSKKKPTTPSSSIRPPTIESLQVSPSSASTSPSLPSSRNTKSSAQSPELSSGDASRMAPSR